MRIRALVYVLLGMGVFSIAGCATIMSGRSQEVSFHSNPEGSTVVVGGKIIGKTPLTTTLKKSARQSLEFRKEGYKTLSTVMDTSTSGWFWGNILIGGLLGSTTDGITGSIYKYSPSRYLVTLEPKNANQLERKTALSDRQKAIQFIVMSYKSILEEVSKGEGPYLESLFKLLKIAEKQQADATKKIKALSEIYTVIPEFAEKATDLYLK